MAIGQRSDHAARFHAQHLGHGPALSDFSIACKAACPRLLRRMPRLQASEKSAATDALSFLPSGHALKCGLTASLSGESRTGGPQSNKAPPNSCSNCRIAVESDGCEMPQIAAAPVNPPTWHTARKY